MTDQSPTALTLEPSKMVKVTKMSRWPLYVFIAGALIAFGVLFYSINFAYDAEEEILTAKKIVIQEKEQPLLFGEGSGLAIKPPKDAVIITPPAPSIPPKSEPIIVVKDAPPAVDPDEENRRRLRQQAFFAALSSPLVVKKVSQQEGGQVPTSHNPRSPQSSPSLQTSSQPAQATRLPSALETKDTYTSSADADKENFLRSRSQADNAWILENERVAGNALEIKTGAVIPGVMITGINSDLPGQIIAQVSQNVFDTNTGRYLLIPQGAKLFGVYDSRVVYGQSRVLVAWNRIIYPDGSTISIGSMAGTDMSGNSGYKDEVNNHYLRIFGSAVLMSLIAGATGYATESGANESEEYSLQSQMTASLAQQLGQTTTGMLQKNLNIKPTLGIRPGYQFNIIVSKDIVFRAPYTPLEQ